MSNAPSSAPGKGSRPPELDIAKPAATPRDLLHPPELDIALRLENAGATLLRFVGTMDVMPGPRPLSVRTAPPLAFREALRAALADAVVALAELEARCAPRPALPPPLQPKQPEC
jgi:hypothetical protein